MFMQSHPELMPTVPGYTEGVIEVNPARRDCAKSASLTRWHRSTTSPTPRPWLWHSTKAVPAQPCNDLPEVIPERTRNTMSHDTTLPREKFTQLWNSVCLEAGPNTTLPRAENLTEADTITLMALLEQAHASGHDHEAEELAVAVRRIAFTEEMKLMEITSPAGLSTSEVRKLLQVALENIDAADQRESDANEAGGGEHVS